MANGTFDLFYESVAHQDGIYGGRLYATDWTGEDGRQWRVSSVDHSTATETMVFEIVDGEVNYFDVAATKEYMENKRDHGAFLAEYLQRDLDESHGLDLHEGIVGLPQSVRIRRVPPDLSTLSLIHI